MPAAANRTATDCAMIVKAIACGISPSAAGSTAEIYVSINTESSRDARFFLRLGFGPHRPGGKRQARDVQQFFRAGAGACVHADAVGHGGEIARQRGGVGIPGQVAVLARAFEAL